MTEATEVAILPVFEGLRTCPVCLGSGTPPKLDIFIAVIIV